MDVPLARRIDRPAWANLRTALGFLLFATSFLAGQRLLEDARQTVEVWSAAADLPRDARLQPDEVVAAEVRLPDRLLARYVPTSRALEGSVLMRPVRAGELIPAHWVSSAEPAGSRSAMSVPVAPEHAVGGAVRPGDRIDIFATFNPGDVRARTTPVVRAAEVIDVVTAGGLVSGDAAVAGVTVSVSATDAARLAFAIRTAEIDVAKVLGTPAPSVRTVTAVDRP